MLVTRGLSLLLVSVATVFCDHVSIVQLPSFLKFSQKTSAVLSRNDFYALVKGMTGMPTSDNSNVEMFSSGIKVPSLFIFLRLAAGAVPLSELSTSFQTIAVESSDSLALKNLFYDINSFYAGNAHFFEMGDDNANAPSAMSSGLVEVEELLKSTMPLRQHGPVLVATHIMETFSGVDHRLKAFAEEIAALFGDSVVIFAIASETKERVRRQADVRDPIAPTPQQLNVGVDYSSDYPVIFNIILWFMIGMFLTIVSVAYCIWFMDPGRDGIIYRMTASRIKKDL